MTSIIGPIKDKNNPTPVGLGLLQPNPMGGLIPDSDDPYGNRRRYSGKTGRGIVDSIAEKGKIPSKISGSGISDLAVIADTLNPFAASLPPQQNTANQLGSSSSNPLTIKVRSNLLSKSYRKNDQ